MRLHHTRNRANPRRTAMYHKQRRSLQDRTENPDVQTRRPDKQDIRFSKTSYKGLRQLARDTKSSMGL